MIGEIRSVSARQHCEFQRQALPLQPALAVVLEVVQGD
jgi:hypothetical protein